MLLIHVSQFHLIMLLILMALLPFCFAELLVVFSKACRVNFNVIQVLQLI